MSRMLFLDLFLFVSFLVELLWRRKNFWAWLATCVGVLVITTNLEMPFQSPFLNLTSPIRNPLQIYMHENAFSDVFSQKPNNRKKKKERNYGSKKPVFFFSPSSRFLSLRCLSHHLRYQNPPAGKSFLHLIAYLDRQDIRIHVPLLCIFILKKSTTKI